MKTFSFRNSLLALTAVGALLAFILACTSFSPDDAQVLYPTIDPDTGCVGLAVYDRESGRSEMRFTPIGVRLSNDATQPALIRGQWIHEGEEILAAWPKFEDEGDLAEEGLNLAVLPAAGLGRVRQFYLPQVKETWTRILYPLAVAGTEVFFPEPETNRVVRMDLRTGAVNRLEGMDKMFLLPSGRDDRLLYLGQSEGAALMEVGWLQVATAARTVLFEMEPLDLGPDEDSFAVSADGRKLAVLNTNSGEPGCRMYERDERARNIRLGPEAEGVTFGNAVFAPDGSVLYAAVLAEGHDGEPGGLGFLEISLGGGGARRTLLIRNTSDVDLESAAYFQIGLSGDGSTLAVVSTYYAFEDEGLRAEDLALFLVNLKDPNRTVKKVPVPRPTRGG